MCPWGEGRTRMSSYLRPYWFRRCTTPACSTASVPGSEQPPPARRSTAVQFGPEAATRARRVGRRECERPRMRSDAQLLFEPRTQVSMKKAWSAGQNRAGETCRSGSRSAGRGQRAAGSGPRAAGRGQQAVRTWYTFATLFHTFLPTRDAAMVGRENLCLWDLYIYRARQDGGAVRYWWRRTEWQGYPAGGVDARSARRAAQHRPAGEIGGADLMADARWIHAKCYRGE